MNIAEKTLAELREILEAYLLKNNYRKTPERFSILEAIYYFNKRFDAEILHIEMINKKYRVSRATIYNTLEILIACNRIVRLHFNRNIAEYEIATTKGEHFYIVCLDCHEIMDIDEEFFRGSAEEKKGSRFGFEIKQQVLNIFGKCMNYANGSCDKKAETLKCL
ncbi:Fur family transcriptional regulator [Flavobacterium sp. FlaQc-51]|uniref:Fur family transcriptional regulator n=1 Tax=Flavobacterium sp. FlaQc-51 TaxID=3374184 RepID=UPI003756AB07